MSKKLRVLTLTLLKNSFSTPQDSKKKLRQIMLLVALAACFAPMVFSITRFVSAIYDTLASVGEEGTLLSLGIAVGAFVIFFFGLFYAMNTFYFSDDIENLLPLPVKSSQILGAKFIIVTIFEYITGGLILLPILIMYGLKSGAGFLYYLYALLIFLTLPIIPIALDSVIVMIIMRFTNLAKNKDTFRMISAIIAIFFGVGLNAVIQRFALNLGTGQIQLGHNSLVDVTTTVFPVAKLGALGLINNSVFSGLIYTCLFIVSSLLGFYLFLVLGNALYYKGVTGISVASSRRKQLSREELSRLTARSSALKSYALKELRILFRTPAYFINCILMNFIWPVLLLIPVLTRPKSAGGIGQLAEMLQVEGIKGMALAAVTAIILFVTSSNGITATSISREGENIFFSKYIPLSYGKQIAAKVLVGVTMGIVGMLSVLIAIYVVLKPQLFQLLLICGTGLPAILFGNFAGVIIDLFNPKLHWDNEQKAVKQNLNLVLSMAVCAVFGGLTVFGVFKFSLNLTQAALTLVAAYGVIDVLLYYYLKKKGPELFRNIES